jgi:hypothetical protein
MSTHQYCLAILLASGRVFTGIERLNNIGVHLYGLAARSVPDPRTSRFRHPPCTAGVQATPLITPVRRKIQLCLPGSLITLFSMACNSSSAHC